MSSVWEAASAVCVSPRRIPRFPFRVLPGPRLPALLRLPGHKPHQLAARSGEKFGLSHQMRRAAVSIAANIAEGFGKRSPAEKARFLNIAEGSLEEVSRLLNAYARAILASGS